MTSRKHGTSSIWLSHENVDTTQIYRHADLASRSEHSHGPGYHARPIRFRGPHRRDRNPRRRRTRGERRRSERRLAARPLQVALRAESTGDQRRRGEAGHRPGQTRTASRADTPTVADEVHGRAAAFALGAAPPHPIAAVVAERALDINELEQGLLVERVGDQGSVLPEHLNGHASVAPPARPPGHDPRADCRPSRYSSRRSRSRARSTVLRVPSRSHEPPLIVLTAADLFATVLPANAAQRRGGRGLRSCHRRSPAP